MLLFWQNVVPAYSNVKETCCPRSDTTKYPPLAVGAEYDDSFLFSFPNLEHECHIDTLDSQFGCVSHAAIPNASRVYCSADLISFNVPNGFLRGCCSQLKSISLNGLPVLDKNGKPPSPFTTCQAGIKCEMASDCDKFACDVLASGIYNTAGVIGFGVNVFDQWLSLLDIKQKHQQRAWLTVRGDGFEASKECTKLPRPFVKVTFPFDDDQTTAVIPFACARMVISSFPIDNCPECGDHGTCKCHGDTPAAFDLGCICDDGWQGTHCDTLKSCNNSTKGNSGCGEHGICVKEACVCEKDWAGLFCSLRCAVCKHGKCEKNCSSHDVGKCICNVGWLGNDCALSACDNNPDVSTLPCSGRGTCVESKNGDGECICEEKYRGKVCDQCQLPGNLKPPWCIACLPGYKNILTNCTKCDDSAGFIRDPDHPGLCVLDGGGSGGLSGSKLALVIGVSFILGLLVFCLIRSMSSFVQNTGRNRRSDAAEDAGSRTMMHDPAAGYVKLNSVHASLLRSSGNKKRSEPWDDDFLFDFNRLRLGRKIGGGTSGEVFIATWDDATSVAAKRLFTPTVGADAFDRAFRREVSLLSQLHHPNIVQLLGVCESPDDGTCYIVTEICLGSLRELIDNEEVGLNRSLALRISLQISSGMLYLHEKDVIHRDLKPGNVLVSTSDQHGTQIQVKLCDFGLSRVKSSMSTLTQMTAAVGTPAYMAPELVRGTDTINSVEAGKAVDVFSFGMLMLELFTRERPYIHMQFNNSYHLLMRVCEGLRPTIPQDQNFEEFGKLCRGCWHQDPGERPSFEQIVLTLKLMEKERKDDSVN
jgi:hypothetical protein